jgi:hypothetical protein
MRIIGWTIQTYTNEFYRLGYVKAASAVEFGNSPIRDKQARLRHIAELVRDEAVFSVTPILR